MTTPNHTRARAHEEPATLSKPETAAAPNPEQKVPSSPRPLKRPRVNLRDVARALRAVSNLNPDAVRTYPRKRLMNIVFDQAITLNHLAEITLYLIDYLSHAENITSPKK